MTPQEFLSQKGHTINAIRHPQDFNLTISEINLFEIMEAYHQAKLKTLDTGIRESWLSPIETERDWQEIHIKKIYPSYPNGAPRWQYLNGLIIDTCTNANIDVDHPKSNLKLL